MPTVKVIRRTLAYAEVQINEAGGFWVKACPQAFHRNWIDPLAQDSTFPADVNDSQTALTVHGDIATRSIKSPPIGTFDDEEDDTRTSFTYALYSSVEEVGVAIRHR